MSVKRFIGRASVAATIVLVLCGFGAMPGIAAKPGEAQEGFAALEKQVREFRLPNGLTFLVLERHAAPVFSFNTAVNAGGVDAASGVTGIAHVFEHMAFKGTPHVGTTDYAKEQPALDAVDAAWAALLAERQKRHLADSTKVAALEKTFKDAQAAADAYVAGNEFGQVLEQAGVNGLNAGTRVDYTDFLYSLPSNKLELWALMEGDRMSNPVLREFYKEREVIVEERRTGEESTAQGRLFEEFLPAAFKAHPYGNGIIGHRSDLENLSRYDAANFFHEHYVAKNMTTAVVGDVSAAEVERLANRYFSGISDAPAPPPVTTEEPRQAAERRVVLEEDAQPLILMGYHEPDMNDPHFHAYEALASVLGDGRSSRLYTRLVKEKKVAVQVGAGAGMPGRKYPNLLFAYIVPASGVDPDSALAVFDAEIERLLKDAPVTKEELDGVKTRERADFWRSIQSNAGMAARLAYFEELTGDWRNLFKQVDEMNAVTEGDVMSAAKECLRRDNRTVGMIRKRSGASS
jgi:predicted Zn-dependent peptidase